MPRTKKPEKFHVFFDGCCDAGGFYTETTNPRLKEAKCPDCGEIATHVVTVIKLQ